MAVSGGYVVSGSDDRTVRCLELQTGKQVWKDTGHSDWVMSPDVDADGTHTVVADQPSLGAARPFFTGWPSEACGRWSNVYDVSHLGSLWYPLDSGAFLLLKGLVRPMGDLYSRISFHRERWYLSPGFLTPQSRIFHIGMTVLCCFVFRFSKIGNQRNLSRSSAMCRVCADLFLILASATMCCWMHAVSKIWHSRHSSVIN